MKRKKQNEVNKCEERDVDEKSSKKKKTKNEMER